MAAWIILAVASGLSIWFIYLQWLTENRPPRRSKCSEGLGGTA